MRAFYIIDIALFLILTLLVLIAYYNKKKRFQREGILFLYRTQLGVKYMDKFSNKYSKILKPLQYVIVFVSYLLMIGIIITILVTTVFMLRLPSDSPISHVLPIAPVIPYFPELFGLNSFFPPFYFIYFIIAIAIIAISHEFAHGIFMRLNKIRIKSTGLAFLGPFIGAFVEQDDKQLNKAKVFPQLSILGAGVFTNTILAIVFGILLFIFFSSAFIPAGVNFTNLYPMSIANTLFIQTQINESSFLDSNFSKIQLENSTYYVDKRFLEASKIANSSFTYVYLDSPSFNSRLAGPPPNLNEQLGVIGTITEINGVKINSIAKLSQELNSYFPGQTVQIKVIKSSLLLLSPIRPFYSGEEKYYNITLGSNNGIAYLGINLPAYSSSGRTKILSYIMYSPIRNLSLYYKSNLGELGIFLFYLLWWVASLNALVALFNMLPAGIFDGGRFFYLTILKITKSKKIAERASKI